MSKNPVALVAADVPVRALGSGYPPPFDKVVEGRSKARLGDAFGLSNFGVNLTRLAPGAATALRHSHAVQDEFVYVLSGTPTLITDEGETPLAPGMCAGFRGGDGNAHQVVNGTESEVVLLEVGDRLPGDAGIYPDNDIQAQQVDGAWQFQHKDGTPY